MPAPPSHRKDPENAFSRKYLSRVASRDGEPDTAAEAYASTVWERVPNARLGYAIVHPAEGPHEPPFATFFDRHHALLAQAVFSFLGRNTLWRLGGDGEEAGYPVFVEGQLAGYLRIFDPNVVPYLVAADLLTRNPQSLAFLLEAASAVALEHAGRYLERALHMREERGDDE